MPIRTFLFGALIAALASPLAPAAAQAGVQAGSPAVPASRAHPEPGDRLAVRVLGEPMLSDTVTVNERGEVPLAKIGVISVSPLSIAEVEDTLRARYASYLRTPAIEVTVLRRVTVSGEVPRANVYFVDVETSLRELIARAGGLTPDANPGKVYLIRNGVRTKIPHWDSDDSRAADLRSGDQIIVGRRSWLMLNAIPAVSAAAVVMGLILSLRK